MSKAIDYVTKVRDEGALAYLSELNAFLLKRLTSLSFIDLLSKQANAGIVSFTMQGVHAHDLATVLDEENIAIRVGHHCTQPLHQSFKVASSARVSLGLYNDTDDIDVLVQGLERAYHFFN